MLLVADPPYGPEYRPTRWLPTSVVCPSFPFPRHISNTKEDRPIIWFSLSVITTMLTCDIHITILSVHLWRPSVCYVPVLYRNDSAYYHTLFSVFPVLKSLRNSDGVTPKGRWIQVGYINFAIFHQAAATKGVTYVSFREKLSPVKFTLAAAAATTGVPYVSSPW